MTTAAARPFTASPHRTFLEGDACNHDRLTLLLFLFLSSLARPFGLVNSCEVEEGYKCAAPRDTADKPPPSPGEPLPDVCVKKPPKKEKEKKEL